jgi:flagellum-specific peptidoglycan hydrolase FlgJ
MPIDLPPYVDTAIITPSSPYENTEEGRVKFANDMYKMGIELGLKPEAAKAFAAQKALESAWGTKLAAPYNFGGTKARPGERYRIVITTEEENGKLKKVKAKFVALKNAEDYKKRMKELLQLPRYKIAREANTYSEYVDGMVAGKYATDSHYKKKLEGLKNSIEKRIQ